jgi:predicted nucleic acid-binding protein
MPAVVSDASVLICLGALGRLHLLRIFYQEILVPEAVWQEVTVAAIGRPVRVSAS